MTQASPLVVEEFGHGAEPVLLLHGLGGTSSTWFPQAAALGADHRFVAPELAGAARSPLPGAGGVSLASHLADIVALLDRLGLARVHVAGHSFGALLALHLAARMPGRVISLVLAGGFAGPTPAQAAMLRERAVAARRDGMAAVATAILPVVLAPDAVMHNPAAAAFVRQSLLAQPAAGYAANCDAAAAAEPVNLEKITCPVLALTGDADRSTPVDVMRAFTSQLAGPVSRVVLPGCGHWATVERARQVTYQMARHTALLRRPDDVVWRPPA